MRPHDLFHPFPHLDGVAPQGRIHLGVLASWGCGTVGCSCAALSSYGVSKERGSTGIGKLEIVKKRAKRTKFGENMGTKEIGKISVTGKHGEPNSGPPFHPFSMKTAVLCDSILIASYALLTVLCIACCVKWET